MLQAFIVLKMWGRLSDNLHYHDPAGAVATQEQLEEQLRQVDAQEAWLLQHVWYLVPGGQ